MHPNIEQLAELADPNDPADGMLRTHVEHCSECQSRVRELKNIAGYVRQTGLRGIDAEHISDDEMIAYVSNDLAADHRERVKAHVQVCGACRKEVLLYRSHVAQAKLRAQPVARAQFTLDARSLWEALSGLLRRWPTPVWLSACASILVAAVTLGIGWLPSAPEMTAQFAPPQNAVLTSKLPDQAALEVPAVAPAPLPTGDERGSKPLGDTESSTPQPVYPQAIAPKPEVALAPAVPPPTVVGSETVAVVIGNRDYSTLGLPNVEFALNDAQAMRDYLVKSLGIDAGRIIYHENATAAQFNEVFGSVDNPQGRLFAAVKPGVSDVFIYYSGHGAPDIKSQRAYFMPVDADPKLVALSGYALDTLYKNLNHLSAHSVTLVLDANFSGSSPGGSLFRDISPALVQVQQPLPSLPSLTLFASAGIQQISAWDKDRKHGLFTYFFLKGLEGAGDANHDGAIAASELNAYLQSHVPNEAQRIIGAKQAPLFVQSQDRILGGSVAKVPER